MDRESAGGKPLERATSECGSRRGVASFELRRLFLERFYLPRRAMNLDLVQQAIAAGELPRDTDADLLIDALTGPLYFRRIIGHAPVSEAFASELASRVLQAFRRPVGL